MEANANTNEYYPISVQYMAKPTLQGFQFNSIGYKKMIVIDPQ